MRKKILILGPDLKATGGVANYYNTLGLHNLDDIGYFAVNSSEPQSGLKIMFRLIFNYFKFSYIVVKKHYKIIHVNPSLDKRSFYRDAFFLILTHLLGRKSLVFFRGWLDEYEDTIKKSFMKSFLFRMSYAKAGWYIVLSESFRKKLIGMGVSEKTTFYIETTVADSQGINKLNLEEKLTTYDKKLDLLFLSRIEKAKGIYIAIDAFKKFMGKYPDRETSLIIAGDGPELPAVKEYVERLTIPKIRFTGYITNDLKRKVLLESHIMFFPSYTEGLPNTILEGMIYGMPVISRITGGIPDVITQGVNGYLSESFDPSIFVDFLSILAYDRDLDRQIALNNHTKAIGNYTTEKVKDRILRIYEAIC
ncbi:MAG: glycosyltransferase family 4 protein [Bacteroidota bacterium]